MQWKVDLPIKVLVGKKYFYLNLNQYRNAHYQILNKAKILFSELVLPLLTPIPHFNKCNFKYVYFAPNKREVDVSNVCSIVDKFFSDVFVSAGKLIDDNYKYLDEVTYAFGGIDPINPRVEVIITSKETKLMKLVLEKADLQIALVQRLSDAYGIEVEAHQIHLPDLDEVAIKIHPATATTVDSQTEESKPKRTRRTKAEIEAEKSTEDSSPDIKAAIETQAAEASIALDTGTASTRTVEVSETFEEVTEEDELKEDVISDIIDEVAPETVSDKPKEPTSIFG